VFNIKPNSKKSYYFDDRFSESKFVRPLLARRNRIIIISLVILILSSVLWFTKSSIDHARELNELKTLVSAFINVSRYNQISESEINLVAEEIYNAGKKYDIDPLLILSVITIESGFNREAVSYMGARGLMQLLPATASSVAQELNIDYSHHNELNDIKTNIALGTYYLYKLSKRYNSNMALYLTAYNYGPENVDRMLREKGGIPLGYSSKIIKTYKKLSF
jgi:soluble lytic murein transglycosylase-like protein